MLKLILSIIVFLGLATITFWFWYMSSDEYRLIKSSVSPYGNFVGVLVGNEGGGAAGWCRDLVYKFDKAGELPDISHERENRKFLVGVFDCVKVKELAWRGNELSVMQ